MLLGLDSQVWQALASIEKKVYFMELRQDAASLSLNDLQRHSAQHRQEIENAATWHERGQPERTSHAGGSQSLGPCSDSQ